MVFTLEELKEAIKLFSVNQLDYFAESCIVALESNNHKSGCKLKIFGDSSDEASVEWSTIVLRAGYQEPKKFVENGAIALSFFLVREYTDFAVIEEATIGTGFDFWLGYDQDHPMYNALNFISARLEISGILKESRSNTIESRTINKKTQTNPTDFLKLPAYISIVEFSQPKAYFAAK